MKLVNGYIYIIILDLLVLNLIFQRVKKTLAVVVRRVRGPNGGSNGMNYSIKSWISIFKSCGRANLHGVFALH